MNATMMRAVNAAPSVEEIAITSASPDRAREVARRLKIPALYDSLNEFLLDDAVAAVYITNSNFDDVLSSIAALGTGNAVLCEKPFAVKVKEGAAELDAGRSAEKLLMQGHRRRGERRKHVGVVVDRAANHRSGESLIQRE